MKKVFIYVGHSNWGKSFALKKITGNSSRIKHTTINNHYIFVRKMSNDDDSKGLLDFVQSIPNRMENNFIIAYCPKHDYDNTALQILQELQQSSHLYFFVQEEKFKDASCIITSQELAYLQQIGTQTYILSGQNTDMVRAKEFETFIKQYI